MLLRILGYIGLALLVFVAAFLVLDPIELAAGVTVLVLLVVMQLRFVVSKLKVKAQAPPSIDASRVAGLLKEIQKSQPKPPQKSKEQPKSKKAKASKATTPAELPEALPASSPATEGETLDTSVFSKFQKNLNQQTTPEPAPVVEADDDVVVSISSQKKNFKVKGQNPYAKAAVAKEEAASKQAPQQAETKKTERAEQVESAPAETAKAEAPAEENLPALKTGPTSSPKDHPKGMPSNVNGKVAPLKKDLLQDVPTEPLGELFSDIANEEEDSSPKGNIIQPKMRKKGVGSKPPMEASEVLTAADLELPDSEKKKDHEDLLLAADQKLKEEKPADGLETVEALLAGINGDEEQETQLEAFKIKANAEFELEKFSEHQKTYETIFKKFIPKTDPEFLPTLEKVMDQYIRAGHQKHAIHFFFTALKEYQTGSDLKRMDVTYYHIEEAYRALEDGASLVKTYQNHLAIKKQREDLIGQLPILDHLGKLLYDQGDQEGSKSCYEQAIAIQQQEA